MKIIVAGATGYVGSEIIRQALSQPSVTSLIALGRRETAIPENVAPGADISKFKSVVCQDFGNYPDAVKKELADADGCIWLLAVTPTKSKMLPWEEVRKICYDYTVTGLETIAPLSGGTKAKPFRFLYTSGSSTARDPNKKPWILGDYCVMRGQVENHVIKYAKDSDGQTNVCVAKPGLITSPGRVGIVAGAAQSVLRWAIGLPFVDVKEVSAAMINQITSGFEKETLENEDLIRIGQNSLAANAEHK